VGRQLLVKISRQTAASYKKIGQQKARSCQRKEETMSIWGHKERRRWENGALFR